MSLPIEDAVLMACGTDQRNQYEIFFNLIDLCICAGKVVSTTTWT